MVTDAPTDRRARRSQRAIKDAFSVLVLDHGYEAVTVDEIAARADVARATFYAHFADKEQLLAALRDELISSLGDQVAPAMSSPDTTSLWIIVELYRHAELHRDLYRVCLSGAGDGTARKAYVDTIAAGALRHFAGRTLAAGTTPTVDLRTVSLGFAGAHTAMLLDWLDDDHRSSADDAAQLQVVLFGRGLAWALGMAPDDLGLPPAGT